MSDSRASLAHETNPKISPQLTHNRTEAKLPLVVVFQFSGYHNTNHLQLQIGMIDFLYNAQS